MSHYDSLFGDGDEFGNENDGRIPSEDEGQPDNDGDENGANAGGEDDGKKVKVEAKQRTVRNPRNTLNIQRMCGPRGIADLETYFKGLKFRGKGHEADDLDAILKRMQHWAHRMYPKYNLDDSLRTIERIGRKKQMHTYMNKYRLGMLDPVVTNTDDVEDDDDNAGLAYDSNALNQPLDPLDSMIEEQLAISRAANLNTSGIADLSVSECNFDALRDDSVRMTTPAPKEPSPAMTDELRAKIAANRLKALEIRKAKMAAAAASATGTNESGEPSTSQPTGRS